MAYLAIALIKQARIFLSRRKTAAIVTDLF